MQDPKLYSHCVVTHKDGKELIPKYIKYLNLSSTNSKIVLDVGCGSGDVTGELLNPLLPKNTLIFGLDIAPSMIDHATKQYPDINFFVHDIGSETIPNCLEGVFDKVFSFHCLHWVLNQRQAMLNIYKFLKYGGNFFSYYVITNAFFDAFYNVAQLEEWKNYIFDAKNYMAVFHNKHNEAEELINNILIDIGFNVSVCKVLQRQYIYKKETELRRVLTGVHPHLHKIPDHLKHKFIDDTMKELFKLKDFQNQSFNNGEVVFPNYIILIVASKPSVENNQRI